MVLTNNQKKTIELLNPWYKGEWKMDLGVRRVEYLAKIDQVMQESKQVLLLLGSRRVGKTWMIWQYVQDLIGCGVEPKKILFLSLDNTNLHDLQLFDLISSSQYEYVLLDEVQYYADWARVLKSLYDLPGTKTKIICSGSSAKQIEDNQAYLTGRKVVMRVYPLGYREFLEFHKNGSVDDYLEYGGYPEYVVEKVPSYLNELLRDIVEKDVVKVHRVANTRYLYDLLLILAKQVGYTSSPAKMAKVLRLDNKTVAKYLEYLREVKLVERVYQYSQSLNERLYAPKKYYFYDLGMRNSMVGMGDVGSLVENAVYMSLVRKWGRERVYYLSDKVGHEVDFVVDVGDGKLWLVESKYVGIEENVMKKVSKIFLKDIYEREIVRRVVVTDGVNRVVKVKGIEVEMVGVEEFLGI